MTVAVAVSITSATVYAQDNLTAKTVKTSKGEVISYTNSAGKVMKKVTLTKKGNVTIIITMTYDADGNIISTTSVAELTTGGENPKLIRREKSIENKDGSKTTEVTEVSTSKSGVTTSKTSSTATKPDGSSTATDTVTTTGTDGTVKSSTTVTKTATDGTTKTSTSSTDSTKSTGTSKDSTGTSKDSAASKDSGKDSSKSEGGDAGSYNPSNGYKNTP